jgi:hypothetical protein
VILSGSGEKKSLATVSRNALIRELHKLVGISFPGDSRLDDVQTRFADNITDDVAQLHVHCAEPLSNVMNGSSAVNDQLVAEAHIGSQLANLLIRIEDAQQSKINTFIGLILFPAHRLLRPGGGIGLLNVSYRSSLPDGAQVANKQFPVPGISYESHRRQSIAFIAQPTQCSPSGILAAHRN